MRTHVTTMQLLGLALLLGTTALPGCASARFTRAPAFDPRVPLRVAVLPFVDEANGDGIPSKPLAALIDLVPILSDDALTRANAATIFRLRFFAGLQRTRLDVVDLAIVDSALVHRSIATKDVYAADRVDAARAIGEALGVDAVVFGEVRAWDRDYYLVESVTTAALRVEMRDTQSGALLFLGEVQEQEVSGISKLPIAYSPAGAVQSVVGESLKGLRNTLFAELADDVVRRLVEGISPSFAERASAEAPRIAFVAHNGYEPLRAGDALTVFAIGSPGARGTFRIGRHGAEVPMRETAPGRYRGDLTIGESTRIPGEDLTVRLESRELLGTTMTIGSPPIRTYAPEAPAPGPDGAMARAARMP